MNGVTTHVMPNTKSSRAHDRGPGTSKIALIRLQDRAETDMEFAMCSFGEWLLAEYGT